MATGLTHLARVWDYKYDLGQGDDSVGGALPSGTVLHEQIQLRIQSLKPTQALLEQGIESIDMYEAFLVPHTLLIANNNQIEITAPANSPYYSKFFRVVGDPKRTSTGASDSRSFLKVNLKRIEKSRSIQ